MPNRSNQLLYGSVMSIRRAISRIWRVSSLSSRRNASYSSRVGSQLQFIPIARITCQSPVIPVSLPESDVVLTRYHLSCIRNGSYNLLALYDSACDFLRGLNHHSSEPTRNWGSWANKFFSLDLLTTIGRIWHPSVYQPWYSEFMICPQSVPAS